MLASLEKKLLYYPMMLWSIIMFRTEKSLYAILHAKVIKSHDLNVLLVNTEEDDLYTWLFIDYFNSLPLHNIWLPYYRMILEKFDNNNIKFTYQNNINIVFSLDKATCFVEYFKLSYTWTWMWRKCFLSLIHLCDQIGIKSISGKALRRSWFNGYYSWAVMGCDFDTDASKYPKQFEKFTDLVQKSDDEDISTVRSITELIWLWKKWKDFWKEYGFTFQMRYDITSSTRNSPNWAPSNF